MPTSLNRNSLGISLPLPPHYAAWLLVRALGNVQQRELGSATSGNYGHAGRPGLVGGSGPGSLDEQARAGIAAIEGLLNQAIAEADYGELGGNDNWDDVPPAIQDQLEEKFIDDELQNGEVDTSDLDDEVRREIERDNADILEKAVNDYLKEPDGPQSVAVDPESVHLTDDGEPTLDPKLLRTKDGGVLTPGQLQQVQDEFSGLYQHRFDIALSNAFDSDSYSERRSELEVQSAHDAWADLSDSQKFEKLSDYGLNPGTKSVNPGPPSAWITGINGEIGTEDYSKTHAIANKLAVLRTEQLFKERGLSLTKSGEGDTEGLISDTWSEWKNSSSGHLGLALQEAITKELGGVSRMSPHDRAVALDAADEYGGMKNLQAYARAQWETTQFVLSKAGEHHTEVYRAVLLEGSLVEKAQKSLVDKWGEPERTVKRKSPSTGIEYDEPLDREYYVKLPNILLQRAGAQSTTGTLSVANSWNGVGIKPVNAQRVVIRMDVPQTSVFSLPVFGSNTQAEHEVVVAGTRDAWKWDAWVGKAPAFASHHIKTKRQNLLDIKHLAAPLTIDLQEIDRGQPHWLKGLRQVKTLGGPGSGDHGHAGRPGAVGGSAPTGSGASVPDASLPHASGILATIGQADGGFTYSPVTGDQPTTGFAVSGHLSREKVLDIADVNLVSLAQYAKDHWLLLKESGNYMGAWHNPEDHKVYLDVSTIVESAQEANDLALRAHQIAYFDLVKGHSVPVEGGSHALKTNLTSDRSPRWGAEFSRPDRDDQGIDREGPDAGGDRASQEDVRGLAKGNFGHAGRPGHVGGSATAHFIKATDAQKHALVLPPAWTDVRVNPDPDGELQAVGIDTKGRTQYRYSVEHSVAASAEKFARIKAFNDAYPAIAKRIAKDAKRNEAAAALLLISKTGFRIGSDSDTRADTQAYGATTLKATHVTVSGDKVDFHFIGKKGVQIHRVIDDHSLAAFIRPRDAKGGRLFNTTDSQVRDYLHSLTPDFTPKDFRTRIATATALRVVHDMPVPKTASAFKYARKIVGEKVAKVLGNNPSEALKSYIAPSVFARWQVR